MQEPTAMSQEREQVKKVEFIYLSQREDERERIVDFNYGLAVEDVAMAQEVFVRAREQGLGTVLTLMEGDLPLL